MEANKIVNISYKDAARLIRANTPNILGENVFLKEAESTESLDNDLVSDKSAESIAPIMACPTLVASVNILDEDDSYTSSRIISDGEQMVFIAPGLNGYIASNILSGQEAIATLVNRIDTGVPTFSAGAAYEMSKQELFTLLAAADLYIRKRMLSQLGHTPNEMVFNTEELVYILKSELEHGDPRWLVSFINDIIACPNEILSENAVSDSLLRLSETGLINSGLDCLAGNGLLFAVSVYRRICAMSILIAGAKEDGTIAKQSSVLLRGERLLWFIDDATDFNGKITLASTGTYEAAELLKEYFRSEGKPYINTVKFCGKCGTPIKAGEKFCMGCGAKL